VIHRDLKPGNVLVTADGTPKVTDFGLAKQLDAEAGRTIPGEPTTSGAILGTPSYMAPEQAGGNSGEVGPAADVYALGVVLYQLLTGRPPFRADTPLETLHLVLTAEPLPPRRLQPRLPRDLDTICLKCLHKEPHRRYANALELADDLRRFLAGEPIRARPVGPVERLWRWGRRNPALAGVSGLAAAAIMAAFALAIGFALTEYRAAEELRREQEKTLAATQEVKRQAAAIQLERGLSLCEQGHVGRGMLLLAGGLELVPADAGDLERTIRTNLAAWKEQIHPMRAVLTDPDRVLALAFSPDRTTAVTGGKDGAVCIWDLTTGKLRCPPMRHDLPVRAVAFSPDGRSVLTGSRDKTARLWDSATGRPLGPALCHDQDVHAVAFSPDGQLLLTGSGRDFSNRGEARLWDAATRHPRGDPLAHGGPVRAVAFSSDGQTFVTGSEDRTARLWDAATGKLLDRSAPVSGWVQAVAAGPDGRTVLLAAPGRTAWLWVGGALDALEHPGDVGAVAFDGRVPVTAGELGGNEGEVRWWHKSTGASGQWAAGPVLPHQGPVDAFLFTGGSVLLASRKDRSTRVWQVKEPASAGGPLDPAARTMPHQDPVYGAAFSPDGRTVFTASGPSTEGPGLACVWQLSPEYAVEGLKLKLAHPAPVSSVVASPDGRTLATGCDDKQVRLWDAASGRPLGQLPHPSYVSAPAWHPDGEVLATGCEDGKARLWDVRTGQLRTAELEHPEPVYAVAFSPDGRSFLTGCGDGKARLWDVGTGTYCPSFSHGEPIRAAAFSRDGQTVATGGYDKTVRFWNGTTGEPVGFALEHPSLVWALAFSPDAKTLLTGCGPRYAKAGEARLWDWVTDKPLGPALRHGGEVRAVAFSPDGKTALTGSLDGTARLWPVPGPLAGEPERIRCWLQVVTGMELDAAGGSRVLDAQAWQERRRRLEELGGPPP
jgi:WD40 repeat protein